MNLEKFKGWLIRAYPGVKIINQSTECFLTSNNKDIQCIISSGRGTWEYLFPGYATVTQDYHIILYCMILWGTPKTEYRFLPDTGISMWTPKKRLSEKIVNPTKTLSTRDKVLEELRNYFGNPFHTVKKPGGSEEVFIGATPGPVIYDYGLIPDINSGHKFTPYSHTEEVRKILDDFKRSYGILCNRSV